MTTDVKKQTVKNKIHELEFPKNTKKPSEKKKVENLYIEADEDHTALQFREKKGDLEKLENNRKNNCLLTKLVYVHEGIEREAPKSKRYRLINPYYFCGTCYSEKNEEFWEDIYEYINNHYDLESVKKIYLNADGGAWIKAGKKRIAGSINGKPASTTYIFLLLTRYRSEAISHLICASNPLHPSKTSSYVSSKFPVYHGSAISPLRFVKSSKRCTL